MSTQTLHHQNWRNYFQQTSIAQQTVSEFDDILQKAQYNTSMSGAVNAVFTAALYAQYNDEHNFYAAIPQVDRSGAASLDAGVANAKAFRAAHDPVDLQTHSEGGEVSDGETYEVEAVEYDIKRSETVLEVSDVQQIEAMISDSVGLEEFWELQEEQLDLAVDRDGLADSVTADGDSYEDTDTITPLDRAIASSDEEDESTDVNGDPLSAGDLDYGTIDRSDDTWADSFVDYDADGSLRQLNKTLVDEFIDGLVESSSAQYEDLAILTGYDSARVLSDIQQDEGTHIHFDGTAGGRDDIEDAQTVPGLAGTTRFRHYEGMPIVANQTAPADTGGLSRVYVIDRGDIRGEPKISVAQYAEPYFERSGRNQTQGYLAQGEYADKALFLLNHELEIRDFSSMGKLTHLEE